MKSQLTRILKAFRNFLFNSVNKEFLIFLFFLALSGGFWLAMTLDETIEKEISIPVKLTNIQRNAIITTDIEDTIKVTVRDKGFAIASYLYRKNMLPLCINFQNYANKYTGKGVIPQSDINKLLYQKLHTSTKIVSTRPDKLSFFFNFGLSKRVPIHLTGRVIPAGSYYLANTSFSPDYITIYANKKLLDSIKYINTEDPNIINFSDTIFKNIPLQKIDGVKCVPTTVKIGLYPDIMTEETLDVPITAINMPKDKVLRTFPTRVNVKFTVGANTYRVIDKASFKVVANYNDILNHPSDKCKIVILSTPLGVKNARLEINKVDYLIEQQ